MFSDGMREDRRRVVLVALAALAVIAGLLMALSAPGGPLETNKAHAYGTGPVITKPTNPKSAAECVKYYGAQNKMADARECRALAARNRGFSACAKKKGAAKVACKKSISAKFKREKAAVGRQRKAEKACIAKMMAEQEAVDYNQPDADQKSQAINDEYMQCMERARKA